MKTIKFGFSIPIKPTLFARLIMWAENTDYDHVYLKWSWTSVDRDIIYQASNMAVNFESNVTFDGHAKTLREYELDIDDDTHKVIMQFCMDNSNKPYSLMQIVGFAYCALAYKLFRAKLHNPFPTHGSSFVCSKICAYIASMIPGIKISSSFDDIEPVDFQYIMDQAVAQGLARRTL